ncbi:MAG: amidophosphoribosyltransferase, partial [Methanobacteriaceae archaeon]|nr:amidophosphoribosyltransferase [Methanobacteriaceae archaeon]
MGGESKVKDKCGIVGIYSPDKNKNIAPHIYYGLYALQHRGQESAGISTSNGKRFYTHKGMGLVYEVFNGKKLKKLKGNIGIGHVRYS